MLRECFDDECPGCRPPMMDVKTERVHLWAGTSTEEPCVSCPLAKGGPWP